jgi:hypothetical protein
MEVWQQEKEAHSRARRLFRPHREDDMIKRLFILHPRSVGESYAEHLVMAGRFGASMIGAGLACLIHALIPGLFEKTGSAAIARLHDRMVENRRRSGRAPYAGEHPGTDAK